MAQMHTRLCGFSAARGLAVAALLLSAAPAGAASLVPTAQAGAIPMRFAAQAGSVSQPPVAQAGKGESACAGLQYWRDHSATAPRWSVSGRTAVTAVAEIADTGTAVFDAVLLSPAISVPSGGLRLHWQQRSRLSWANTAGVLEICIGDGNWLDFIAAGGQFLRGGYNHRSFAGNPLRARPAWGGEDHSSETEAVLPASSHRQSIQLRFRLASGGTGDLRPGWRISGLTCQP
jgi:hypothetical protein